MTNKYINKTVPSVAPCLIRLLHPRPGLLLSLWALQLPSPHCSYYVLPPLPYNLPVMEESEKGELCNPAQHPEVCKRGSRELLWVSIAWPEPVHPSLQCTWCKRGRGMCLLGYLTGLVTRKVSKRLKMGP